MGSGSLLSLSLSFSSPLSLSLSLSLSLQFNLPYWHDVTMFILPKLTLDIYDMKMIRIKIVNGTKVTTITKGQNNHTLNNNNKHLVDDIVEAG